MKMGAQCSKTSSTYLITFLGADAVDRLLVLDFLRIRPGRVAAKQLTRIASIIEEIAFHEGWFFGGRCPSRPMVYNVYNKTDGLVYVVDSSNEDQLEEELSRLNNHILKEEETQNMVIMLLANKQDEEGALSMKQIESKVGEILSNHDPKLGGRILFLRGCNSETKMGLEEAFSQFAQILQLHRGGQMNPGLQTLTGDELNAFGKRDKNSRLHSLKKMFDMSYMKSVLLY